MRRTERQHHDHELEPGGKGVLFFLSLPVVFGILLFLAVSCDDPDPRRTTAVESSTSTSPATEARSEPAPLERVRLPEDEKESDPEPPAGPVTFEAAAETFHDGRHGEAVTLFEAYVRDDPADAWGHYMLGLSAWKQGDLERAERALREASDIDVGHRKARVNLARVLLEEGRVDEARRAVREALEIDPEAPDALRVAGRVAEEEGRADEAADAYRSAILADPEDAWAMNNLGLLHIRRGAFHDALPPLARAVELRDDVPVFRNNLGVALERTESYAAAADAYRAADTLGAGHTKARTSLARVEELEEARGSVGVDLAALADAFTRSVERWRDERTAEAPSDLSPGSQHEDPEHEGADGEDDPEEDPPVERPREESVGESPGETDGVEEPAADSGEADTDPPGEGSGTEDAEPGETAEEIDTLRSENPGPPTD